MTWAWRERLPEEEAVKKEDKARVVAELEQALAGARMVVVSEYRGMKAGDSDQVRRRLREVGAQWRVAKNTLLRRAFSGTVCQPLGQTLSGPVAVVFGLGDPVALAKSLGTLRDFGDKLKVRGAVLGGRPLSPGEIQELASLPPREVLLGRLCGLLLAPAQRLVRLLNEPASALARLVDAIAKAKGEPGGTAAA